jgi:hypothetical protein
MTQSDEFARKLANLHQLVRDYLGRLALGEKAYERVREEGNAPKSREALEEVCKEGFDKGAKILVFLEKCIKDAEQLPAKLIAEAVKRKVPEPEMEKIAVLANKASQKLRSFFKSIELYLNNILKDFKRNVIPQSALDTFRIYMVLDQSLVRANTNRLTDAIEAAENAIAVSAAKPANAH